MDERAVTAKDRAFLIGVYAAARREEFERMGWTPEQISEFIQMQFGFQQRGYEMRYPAAQHSVLLFAGEPAGQWRVQRGDDAIILIDIALLERFRGRGIGSTCIAELCREAARRSVELRLGVRPDNRAQHLYRRLGFDEVSRDDACIHLAWRAPRIEGVATVCRASAGPLPISGLGPSRAVRGEAHGSIHR